MSSWDVTENVDFDVMARYVDVLPAQTVPSYCTLDLRLGWRPWHNLELSVVGKNLFDSQHLEFGNRDGRPTPAIQTRRGVYGYLVWKH